MPDTQKRLSIPGSMATRNGLHISGYFFFTSIDRWGLIVDYSDYVDSARFSGNSVEFADVGADLTSRNRSNRPFPGARIRVGQRAQVVAFINLASPAQKVAIS